MNSKAKKNTNPLYVVKGDQVEPAENFFDMLIKKFNFSGVVDVLNALFKTLLDSVKTYAGLAVIIEFFDLILEKLKLFKQFSLV